MVKTKKTYSYLVAVLVYFRDTGMNVTASVDVEIDFRITRATVPALLERIKETLAKEDFAGQKLPKNALLKITAFSRYEDE